jgi:hypothetical protein
MRQAIVRPLYSMLPDFKTLHSSSAIGNCKLVSWVQKSDSKLFQRVTAAIRNDGDERHAAIEQIVRGLNSFPPRFLDDLQDTFGPARFPLNYKHRFSPIARYYVDQRNT